MLTACSCCGLIQSRPADGEAACGRCRTRLRGRPGGRGNEPAAALAATALVFYPLALLAPFLRIERLGQASESSLLGGISSLFADRHYAVGSVVLLFSVLLPAVKLVSLLALSLSPRWVRSEHRAVTYRVVEQLGRWGMLDVLLVAVLVAFVKLGDLVSFTVGPGLWMFAGFALLNLMAGLALDPHLLWDETMDAAADSETRPTAKPRRRTRWAWVLLPVVGLGVAAAAAVALWPEPALRVSVRLQDGRGLKAGDPVKYRGVAVGEVADVTLDGGGVQVLLDLRESARPLSVEGTRWWVVRPELGLTGAAGLETVLGSKFVTLLPGGGAAATEFVGLESPPLVDLAEAGGLEVVVQSNAGPRLSPGAGVYHRGVRVGGVRAVGLASDASAVEYRVYVRPRFRRLITQDARFWNTGGASLGVGLDGVRLRVESISELLAGGMGVAVQEPGPPAAAGTRFPLYERPEDEWLSWRPSLGAEPNGEASGEASAGADLAASLVAVQVTYQDAGFFSSWSGPTSVSLIGVVTGESVLCPLREVVPRDAEDVTVRIGGAEVAWDRGEGQAVARLESTGVAAPSVDLAAFDVPVDGRLIGPQGETFLSAAQWVRTAAGYRLPQSLSVADGTPLLRSEDGAVIAVVAGGRLVPVIDETSRG